MYVLLVLLRQLLASKSPAINQKWVKEYKMAPTKTMHNQALRRSEHAQEFAGTSSEIQIPYGFTPRFTLAACFLDIRLFRAFDYSVYSTTAIKGP